MREKSERPRPTRELEAEPGGDRRRGAKLAERSADHERWIGGEADDPACRGID